MTCPKCNKIIYRVYVESRCTQTGFLGEGPERDLVKSYEDLTVEGPTIHMSCPECGKDIKQYIREE